VNIGRIFGEFMRLVKRKTLVENNIFGVPQCCIAYNQRTGIYT
jgi:hypothetical protein